MAGILAGGPFERSSTTTTAAGAAELLDPASLTTKERLVRVYLQGDQSVGGCDPSGPAQAISVAGSNVSGFVSNVAKLRRVAVSRGANTVRVIEHVNQGGRSHTSAETLRCPARLGRASS